MIKLKRKECFEKYPIFPRSNDYHNKYFYPESVDNYRLTVQSKSADKHIAALIKELLRLINYLNITGLVFLGDTSVKWMFQENDFVRVQEAFEYLKQNKIGKTFNGGLFANKNELPDLLRHLFWLGRCNSMFPLVYFMDKEQSFVANICKYGNIHLSILSSDAELSVTTFLEQENTSFILLNECSQQFSNNSRIKGRRSGLQIVNPKS